MTRHLGSRSLCDAVHIFVNASRYLDVGLLQCGHPGSGEVYPTTSPNKLYPISPVTRAVTTSPIDDAGMRTCTGCR